MNKKTKIPSKEEIPSLIADKLVNDKNNMITRSLFLELVPDRTYTVFTLSDKHKGVKDKEGNVTPVLSLKRLYVEYRDVTEVSFAEHYFGSYEHWKKILELKEVSEVIGSWRDELRRVLQYDAIQRIEEISTGDRSKDTFSANKFLVEWYGKPAEKAERKQRHKIDDRDVEDEWDHDMKVLEFAHRRV